MNDLINFFLDYFWPIIILTTLFLGIMLISCFRIFEKAKIDGYKVFIPIYNLYLFVKIADLPIFMIPLLLLPIINIFAFWMISIRIGSNFGKERIFQIGLCIFPIFFYPVLAFSNSLYKASTEVGTIRPQDENATMYNQFPEVTEVVEENDPEMENNKPIIEETKKEPVTNALGIVEDLEKEDFILEVDNDSTWQDEQKLSEIEQTKKIVTIDPLKDDPLFSPDAKPIKVANLDQYKICPNCGAKLDHDAKTCFLCGAKIEEKIIDENL